MSDYIPEGILVQILKLLPVKNLLQSRCVCKCWKQVIDSPFLVQEHLSVQKPQFVVESDGHFLVLDPLDLLSPSANRYSFADEPCRFTLLGTLHGIICLYDYDSDSPLLWNPSIKKVLTLPRPDISFKLDLDEYWIATYSSFWIDPSSKEFKIIMFNSLLRNKDDVAVYANLYSSIHQRWKVLRLDKALNCKPGKENPSVVVIGGVAYWRAIHEAPDEEGNVTMDVVVLSFAFGLERFDIIQGQYGKHLDWGVLCKWQDTLSLVFVDSNNRCEVYLRREGSWINMFAFNLPSDVSRVLWVTDGRDTILVQDSTKFGRELVLFEAEAGAGFIPLMRIDRYDFFLAYDFVESLLFP